MYILKIAGAVLLIFSTTLYGFQLGNAYLTRIENLKELKKCILLLDGELKYNSTPLRIAMDRISLRNQSVYSSFLKRVSKLMEEDLSMDISRAWEKSVDEVIDDKYCLKDSDLKKMIDFGKTMNLDSDSRKAAFEGYLFELEMDVRDIMEDKDNKVKMYRTLGIMAGLFITVLIV